MFSLKTRSDRRSHQRWPDEAFHEDASSVLLPCQMTKLLQTGKLSFAPSVCFFICLIRKGQRGLFKKFQAWKNKYLISKRHLTREKEILTVFDVTDCLDSSILKIFFNTTTDWQSNVKFNPLQINQKLPEKHVCTVDALTLVSFLVPEQVPVLTASNAQKDSILLVWGPPLETNGVLTGYLLQYHHSMYIHNGL